MKATDKNKPKKTRSKPKAVPKQKVLVVAQELKFARLLAGNEKTKRDKVLKSLKKWLVNCNEKDYDFKEEDFTRVWKGLFYAVWMSDKPLVQEELCDNIAATLEIFPPEKLAHAVLMMKAALKVLASEWYGLDQHRIDKFLMLVRRLLRSSLRCVAKCDWSLDSCTVYTDMLAKGDGLFALKTPSYARNAISLQMHICDCLLEELSKVSNGDIPPDSLVSLLEPFVTYMCRGAELRVAIACRRILNALIRQSDAGLEYQQRKAAWERMGCPVGGPDALAPVSDDESDADDDDNANGEEINGDDETQSQPALDPRAGKVHVVLHPLPVPASKMADLLKEKLRSLGASAHTRAKLCLKRFEQLARDEYPLKVQDTDIDPNDPSLKNPKPTKAAKRLRTLERKLVADSDELALRGLSRKHRKRLLAKSREGISIVEELATLRQNNTATMGKWKIEETQPKKNKNQEDKENQDKKGKKRKNNSTQDESPSKKQKIQVKEKPNKPSKVKIVVRDKAPENKLEKKSAKKQKLKIVITESPKKQQKDKKPIKNVEVNKKPTETKKKDTKQPLLVVNKVRNFQKPVKFDKKVKSKDEKTGDSTNVSLHTPKKVKFVLKNNSMQGTIDYYKSVRQSPNIPFDSSKKPIKTNLKPNSTPSPINPFFKRKLRVKN